ncbi:WRKY family transcription factor [Tanacetum coccineum]
MAGDTPLPKQPIDKAYSIASIKACIPTPLDLDKVNYNSWSSLFQRFCKTYEVHHHLEPPSTTTTTSTIDPLHESNDSLVVMWIYSTISPKLVEMIVDVDSTAYGVWKRLKDLFHDNKDARITQLDNEIRNMAIGNSSITDFFQQIKSKADRLADLGSPVQDSSLVTYAINGIRSKYPEAARIIRLRESAPTFDKLRSLMLLEESDLSQPSNGNSLFHNTSSSPRFLVASTTSNARTNTMNTSGFDQCRNFHRGNCTFVARCKFVHGIHDARPIPLPTDKASYTPSGTTVRYPPSTNNKVLHASKASGNHTLQKAQVSSYHAPARLLNYDASRTKLEHGYRGILSPCREHSSDSNVASVFDIVHSDLWTSPISSESGIKYYAIFLDHFSHYVWVYPFLLRKSDLFDTFVTFRAYVNQQFNVDIKALQCDHGGEFDNARFHTLFPSNRNSVSIFITYTSLILGGSPQHGRSPFKNVTSERSSYAINNEIPFAKLYNKKPTYDHLRVFGCLCYPHIFFDHKPNPRPPQCVNFMVPHGKYISGTVLASNHRSTNTITNRSAVNFDENNFPLGSMTPDILLPTISYYKRDNNTSSPTPASPATSPFNPYINNLHLYIATHYPSEQNNTSSSTLQAQLPPPAHPTFPMPHLTSHATNSPHQPNTIRGSTPSTTQPSQPPLPGPIASPTTPTPAPTNTAPQNISTTNRHSMVTRVKVGISKPLTRIEFSYPNQRSPALVILSHNLQVRWCR